MIEQQKQRFLQLWDEYFPGAELPITFFRSDDTHGASPNRPAKGWRCFIGDLAAVRAGTPTYYEPETLGCGVRFLGFGNGALRPQFAEFISCGVPDGIEGERYKQTPEIVKAGLEKVPFVPAGTKYVVFKRWDALEEGDDPEVVIFFATPDVLSGLFTWAGFDEVSMEAVAAPFGAGCASIVQYPLLESVKEHPRAILGMFDVSARPRVPQNVLTFAVPWAKFERMLDNADETFLTTKSWARVRRRIAGDAANEEPPSV